MNISAKIGYAAAFGSTILLGSMGLFVRNISANGYVITFSRLALGLIFLTIALAARQQLHCLKVRLSYPLILSGIVLGITSLCYIQAIGITTLANAVFLLYLGPLFGVGLTTLILKEHFTWFNAAILGLAFLGFCFMLEFNFNFQSREADGYLWGLGSALCFALFIVTNRGIESSMPSVARSFYQFLFGALIMIPFLGRSLLHISMHDIYWLVAVGFFNGFLGLGLAIVALRHLKAVQYGTITYLEPLVATFIGFLAFHEHLSGLKFVGCTVILLGGLIQVFHTKQRG